jgi:hypothetical protein
LIATIYVLIGTLSLSNYGCKGALSMSKGTRH